MADWGLLWWPVVTTGLLYGCVVALAFLSLVFLVAHRLKRYDLIDSAWGMTFVVIAVAWVVVLRPYHPENRSISRLIVALIAIWAIRLSGHIFARFLSSSQEDKRYIELRSTWKSRGGFTVYRKIYMTQALLATLISLPVLVVLLTATGRSTSTEISSVVLCGIGVWVIGIVVEALSDYQLKLFVRDKNNRGKTMRSGLWKYSRHPNYFGEVLLWWGIGIFSAGVSSSIIGLVGPALLTYLIVYISGIPPAEARAAKRADWADYARRTSVLIPWLPKKELNN